MRHLDPTNGFNAGVGKPSKKQSGGQKNLTNNPEADSAAPLSAHATLCGTGSALSSNYSHSQNTRSSSPPLDMNQIEKKTL